MSQLQDLINQQSAIQAEIEKLQRANKAAAVAQVHAYMREYGLTVADLGSGKTTGAGSKVPPKYRDAAGNTWTGRGKMPTWLANAVAAGAPLGTFAITP